MLWIEQLVATLAAAVRGTMVDAVFLHGTTFTSLDAYSIWEFRLFMPPLIAELVSVW